MSGIQPTFEIMGTFMSSQVKNETQELMKDPKGFIFSQYDIDTNKLDINIVENEGNTVNIALPYYAGLENYKAKEVGNEEIETVAGGEIVIAAFIGATAAGIFGGVAIATGGALYAVNETNGNHDK